jgi:hypothetical protein
MPVLGLVIEEELDPQGCAHSIIVLSLARLGTALSAARTRAAFATEAAP